MKKGGECYCIFERRRKGIEKLSNIINFEKLEELYLDLHQFEENEMYKEASSVGFSEVKVKEKDFLEFLYHKLIRKHIPTSFLKILGYPVSEFIDELFKSITKEYSVRLDII